MPQVDIKIGSRFDPSGFTQLGTQLDRIGQQINKKLSLPDIGKSILGGLGIGTGFGLAQQLSEQLVKPFKEAADYAERIAQYSERSAKAVSEMFRNRRTAEDQIEFTRGELESRQRLLAEVSARRVAIPTYDTVGNRLPDRLIITAKDAEETAKLDAEVKELTKDLDQLQRRYDAELDSSLVKSAIAEQAAIDEARQKSIDSGNEILGQRKKESDQLDEDINKSAIAAAQEREREQERAAERARDDIAAQRKAQQDAEATAAIRAAQDAVEQYDTALQKLDANPYLTDNEKQAERVRLLNAQTQAIKDQKAALDAFAAAHPGVDVGGLTAARDQIGNKGTRASVETYRTANRQTGILGGIVGQLDAIGTWADQLQRAFTQLGDTIRTSLGSALADAVLTAGSAKDRIVNFANAIGTSFVQTAAQMVADWLWAHTALDTIRSAFKAKEIGETAGTEAAKTGIVVAGEATRTGAVAAAAATNTAVITSAAAAQAGPTGVAAVFRSIMELGPIAGPLVFAASVAAMVALISQLVQGFESGGVIGGGPQLIRVNENGAESVLNANATAALGADWINAANSGLFHPITRPGYAPNVAASGGVAGTAGGMGGVAILDGRDRLEVERVWRHPSSRRQVVTIMKQERRALGIRT